MKRTLEKRVESLEKKLESLYHLAYARLKRRSDQEARALVRIRRWMETMKNADPLELKRLGRMLGGARKGRTIWFFSPQERSILSKMLKRQRKFAPKLRGLPPVEKTYLGSK